jgi:hypothetical protein
MLQDAKIAFTRAKRALIAQASSGTAKNAPVKQSQPTSKATPQPARPKRKPSAAGGKAAKKATGKKPVVKRATPVKARAPRAAKKVTAKTAAVKPPADETPLVVRETVMVPGNPDPVAG